MIKEGVDIVMKNDPTALTFDVGNFYNTLANYGINFFGKNAEMVAQCGTYIQNLKENKKVNDLFMAAQKAANEKEPLPEREVKWETSLVSYCSALRLLINNDIPGIKMQNTIHATIEKNTQVTLGEQGIAYMGGSQLAIGQYFRKQITDDKESFEKMNKKWLPKDESSEKEKLQEEDTSSYESSSDEGESSSYAESSDSGSSSSVGSSESGTDGEESEEEVEEKASKSSWTEYFYSFFNFLNITPDECDEIGPLG